MEKNTGVPVTDQTRNELRELKPPSKTYDEFLQEFIEQKRGERLAADVKAVFERADNPAVVITALENCDFDTALSLLELSNPDAQAFIKDWQREATQLIDSTE